MLVELTVKNFRSFGDPQIFSMVASNLAGLEENTFEAPNKEKFALLKSALIYGANASGKSNLLQSLRALSHIIKGTRKYDAEQDISCYEPCKVDQDLKDQSLSFEIEFYSSDIFDEIDNRRYNYKIEFNKSRILLEQLSVFKTARPTNVFLRIADKEINWGSIFSKKDKEFAVNNNQAILSVAGNLKKHFLNNVYTFFSERLMTPSEPHVIGATSATSYMSLIHDLKKDTEKNLYRNLLKIADIGIEDLHIEKIDLEYSNLPKEFPEELREALQHQLLLTHPVFKDQQQVANTDFRIEEESDGTRRLLSLSNKIFKALAIGGVLIIDEIETSLHPEISGVILELFSKKETNPFNAQLIATTHDITLLNAKRLRRDQIWFAEKNHQGQTNLYSLVEFKNTDLRKDTPFGTWYLNGRFGAIPTIGPITHLRNCEKCKG